MKKHISLLAVTVLALLGFASAAQAATIQVTTTTDEFASGTRCSLREAVWSANNDSTVQAPGCTPGSGTDLIVVPSGTFTLSRGAPTSGTTEDADVYGDLDVSGPLSIVHHGIRPAVLTGQISGERVIENLAGASLHLDGLTITRGEVINEPGGGAGSGGGILNQGYLTMDNSTVVDNRATFGGGLATAAGSSSVLANVTFAFNGADEDGGAISVEAGSGLSLLNVTVADNAADYDGNGGGDGGGLFASTTGAPATLTLRDTIVASNSDSGKEAPNCARLGGTITSLGRNLVDDTNGCDYVAGPGDILNLRGKLVRLRDNGGPTQTYALRKGSPAIDAGKGCTGVDQRGVWRGLGGKCDIGAWELVRCQGAVVNIVGTDGPDLLTGSSGVDGILALDGNDTVRAGGGRDGVCGDGGKDHLEGGAGPDRLDGGSGRDTCLGGGGVNRERRCELPRHHGKR